MKNQPVVAASEFKKILLAETPLIDVRAPIEFGLGHIPGAVNLPILSDEHRNEIGTIYKQQGNAAAVKRGYELVSGDYKTEMIQSWSAFISHHPDTILTCFRGGQRSQITQAWLSEIGLIRPRIDGGYKAFRQFILQELERLSTQPMIVISGPTGSGKTILIDRIKNSLPVVNLEALANHRGSAFGQFTAGQPSQADYENQLTQKLLKIEAIHSVKSLIVEDESRLIGRTAQPETFFNQLRASAIIFLDQPLNERVEVIFEEYVLNDSAEERTKAFKRYVTALTKISKKLGGLRYQELQNDLATAIQSSKDHNDHSQHHVWIEKLLVWYYDPLYLGSLDKRKPTVIFRGTRAAAEEYLIALK